MRVSGKAYTSQLPFGERVMYQHTAVPTDNLNQRWGHGILIGEAPMTDECIILTENGIQKAKSSHRATPKEKFLISELENAREFPWNDVAENLKSAIETSQDQDSSDIGVCVRRSRSLWEACRVRSRRALADGREREFENGRSRSWINCKNDRGAPTANSGDAAGTVIITIFQSYCADARTDTKHSERAGGFTDGNGSTGTQSATE